MADKKRERAGTRGANTASRRAAANAALRAVGLTPTPARTRAVVERQAASPATMTMARVARQIERETRP